MPEAWTGDLVGKMHNAEVTYEELAAEIGCGKSYLSMVLNGKRKPKDAEKKFNAAFDRVIERKRENEHGIGNH